MPRTAVVLLAAGEGRRVGTGTNKVLLPLLGVPVFTWSLRRAFELPCVSHVVLVIRPEDREGIDAGLDLLADEHPGAKLWVVPGGATRHGSEWNAFSVVAGAIDAGEIDVVAIHDSARPLAEVALFEAVVRAAHRHGGALPVRARHSLVSRDSGGTLGTELVGVQTPQAFSARPLLDAYRQAERDGFTGTDTASCVEEYTHLPIHCVPSPATNIKITFAEDIALAERLLRLG